MARRRESNKPHWQCWWPAPGLGRFQKRQYHKAVRALARNHGGRERSVICKGSECNWKTW
jgi:hypothetical protein